jgi:hypothetical protein
VLLEGVGQLKNPMISSEIKALTCGLVPQQTMLPHALIITTSIVIYAEWA